MKIILPLSLIKVSCCVCQKNFLLRKNLIRHMKNIHKIAPHTFATASPPLPAAASRTEPEEVSSCRCCAKTFYYKSDRLNHEALHAGIRSHACDQCAKSYCTAKSLKKHRQVVHLSSAADCTCPVCHKVLSTRLKLRAHRLTHSSLRPFACRQCGQRFKEKRSLLKHIKLKKHGGGAEGGAPGGALVHSEGEVGVAAEKTQFASQERDAEQPDSTEFKYNSS
jgi:hypothetical protein